jgi:hypothetical protein
MRPELDQLPGACKNWFTVSRWVDVANRNYGVTWITLDAPLIEVGELSARLLGSQNNPDVWRKKVEKTQRIYSWAMNNHWGTNYRAYQDGPVVFRYVLWPHGKADTGRATRLAVGRSQPLIVALSGGAPARSTPKLRLSTEDVVVIGCKPSDDGKAWIVRLFGTASKDANVKLQWAKPEPKAIWLSDTSERPLEKISGAIAIPALGLVTVRADLADEPGRLHANADDGAKHLTQR